MKTNYVLFKEKSPLHRININGILFMHSNGHHSRLYVGNGSNDFNHCFHALLEDPKLECQVQLQGKCRENAEKMPRKCRENAEKMPRKNLETAKKLPPDCLKTAGKLPKDCWKTAKNMHERYWFSL